MAQALPTKALFLSTIGSPSTKIIPSGSCKSFETLSRASSSSSSTGWLVWFVGLRSSRRICRAKSLLRCSPYHSSRDDLTNSNPSLEEFSYRRQSMRNELLRENDTHKIATSPGFHSTPGRARYVRRTVPKMDASTL